MSAPDLAMQAFLASFSADKFARYMDRMEATVGHRYPYSTTPVFLSQDQFDRLVATTHAVVRLLQSPQLQKHMLQHDWFLPWNDLKPHDYFGCVDFHMQGDQARIIEVNFNVPGRVGLLELMEHQFLSVFAVRPSHRVNAGFEKKLVEAVTENGRHSRVAIAVSPLKSSRELRPHYEYIATIFRKYGVDAQCVFANHVDPGDGQRRPRWNGSPYDVVLNLLIPGTWEANQDLFANYSALYCAQPDRFVPSPQGWRLGTKRLLTIFNNLFEQPLGLGDSDCKLIARASLRSHLVSDFEAASELIEAFGGRDKLVLKPMASYRSQGVFVQPSERELESVFRDNRNGYVAQELFLAEGLPSVTAEGKPSSRHFEIRVGFMNGRVNRMRGSNCANLEMTPVIVTS
ncbi:MAG: hypothetical protein DHS20C11_14990 [Lysobacteraceae bacterium]|nr:MAG: hypothetical protein DHS20C11_14990 [Xanthomonadaceae bacterium]